MKYMFEPYLRAIVDPLITRPDVLKVEQSQDQMGVLLTIYPHKDDMGTIIGKEGETAKSIRCLMRVQASKYQARVSVKIMEPADGKYALPKTLDQAIEELK